MNVPEMDVKESEYFNGQSPFSIGNASAKSPFSIAMLVYQRVYTSYHTYHISYIKSYHLPNMYDFELVFLYFSGAHATHHDPSLLQSVLARFQT